MQTQQNGHHGYGQRSPPGAVAPSSVADQDSDVHSGDDNEHDLDQDDGDVVRTENGKRKRPISVSYVPRTCSVVLSCAHFLRNVSIYFPPCHDAG
jgi:hypothetical protein